MSQDGSEKAREHYTQARDILQAKLNELKNKPSENSSNINTAEGSSAANSEEVKELEQLITELNEKVLVDESN